MSGSVAQVRVAEQALARADAAHALAESAHVRHAGHEDLCAQRYGSISDTLVELRSDLKDQQKLLWTMLMAVCGATMVVLVGIVLKAVHLS